VHESNTTTLGISLYSYLYLKLAKTLPLSYYLFVSSSTKSEDKREVGQRRVGEGNGDSPNNVYTCE
jgi:hypothetical protein